MPFFGHPWSYFIAKNVCVACSCHKYKRINNTHADPNFTSPCVATKTRNYSLILSFHLLFLAKKIYRTYKNNSDNLLSYPILFPLSSIIWKSKISNNFHLPYSWIIRYGIELANNILNLCVIVQELWFVF